MSGQFVIIPARALDDLALRKSPAAYMVLCTLSTYANRDGFCNVRKSTLAKRSGCSTRSIGTHTAKLQKLGYIEIIPRYRDNHQIENGYRIDHNGILPIDRDYRGVEGELLGGVEGELLGRVEGELPTERLSLTSIKEKKPLTRYSFCREINRAIKSDDMGDEFSHLGEAEIVNNTGACLDWLEMKFDILPVEGKGIFHMRAWLRKGMSLDKVSKPARASKGEHEEISVDDLPEWQQKAIANGLFEAGVFKSWIKPLEWNGNGTVYAPTRFIAEKVENTYMPQLVAALHADIKIEVKP